MKSQSKGVMYSKEQLKIIRSKVMIFNWVYEAGNNCHNCPPTKKVIKFLAG